MTHITQRYRKRPVEVEVVRWDGTPSGATSIIDWILDHGGTASYRCNHLQTRAQLCPVYPEAHHLAIATLEGTMRADVGDWIIRGVQGEFYPCKPDIFADTYEEVSDD